MKFSSVVVALSLAPFLALADGPAVPLPSAAVPMSGTAVQQFRVAVRRALPAVVTVNPGSTNDDLGSGVIIRSEGIVLTSAHVLGASTKVTVTLQDKRVFTCTSISKDADTDLAIVKLPLTGNATVPFAQFGKSDELEIGDWVLAMGSPYGLTGSVSAGIVSGKSRTLGQFRFEDFLQIDAAVNPGSSGGPVINSDGDIVGINTAIKTKGGGFQGIALAVPSSMASLVADELIMKGTVTRGYVGLRVANGEGGLLVKGVVSDTSPAAKAGFLANDIVTSVDGAPMPDTAALSKLLFTIRPAQKLVFQIKRAGEPQQLTVTAAEAPAAAK